ncbi:MAG: hypothetical protein HGA90_03150 [Alphaproteobacteria bacterium]|nr:hypothetical protein [Alphaproteobacteria bacterium]
MEQTPLLRVGFFSNNVWPWQRQTPAHDGVFGACRFIFDGQGPFDYAVVYDGLTQNLALSLPRERTLFVASEPVNVKRYNPRFTAQFGALISADPCDPHPRKIMRQAGLPWHYGIRTAEPARHHEALTFRDLNETKPTPKTKDISIICSNKNFTPEHRQRLRFVEELKAILGERVDVFGRGFREIADKAEVLDSYRYHVALENCDFADYWTEKIADPFLARAFPFYWGCRNLEDYFPADSFFRLEIDKPREAATLIAAAVNANLFDKRQKTLEDARRRVLQEHNLFALLERTIAALHKNAPRLKTSDKLVLRQEHAFAPRPRLLREKLRAVLMRFPLLFAALRFLRNLCGRGRP